MLAEAFNAQDLDACVSANRCGVTDGASWRQVFRDRNTWTWQSIVLVDLNVDNPIRKVRLSFLSG